MNVIRSSACSMGIMLAAIASCLGANAYAPSAASSPRAAQATLKPSIPAEDWRGSDDLDMAQLPYGTVISVPVNLTIYPEKTLLSRNVFDDGRVLCDVQFWGTNVIETLIGQLEMTTREIPETHTDIGTPHYPRSYQAFVRVDSKLNDQPVRITQISCGKKKPLLARIGVTTLTIGELRASVASAGGSVRVPAPQTFR